MGKKTSIALITACLISLSSCANDEGAPPEEVTVTASESLTLESSDSSVIISVIESASAAEKTVSEKETAENAESFSDTITPADKVPEEDMFLAGGAENELSVYTDERSGRDFIIVNITPQKIYWNDISNLELTVGQPVDMPLPAVFEEWLNDSDEIMMYLDSSCGTFGSVVIDGEEIIGMTYPQYWSTDYLCPISEGTVHFGEYTEEIRSSFSRIDDGVYIEEANFGYEDNPFEDNMSVDALDLYFETIKSDHDALMKKIEEDPYTYYDIAGFWGYQSGARFRAEINFIN